MAVNAVLYTLQSDDLHQPLNAQLIVHSRKGLVVQKVRDRTAADVATTQQCTKEKHCSHTRACNSSFQYFSHCWI